jgi:hypothetical protein
MGEQIRTTIVRRQETKTFCIVEPFDFTSEHLHLSF